METPSTNSLIADLDHILRFTEGLWDELRNKQIFITGGTGFFGCWLLESVLWANDELGLNTKVVILTRDAAAFSKRVPHLALHSSVILHEGDVRTFAFPEGEFDCIIHAATDATLQVPLPILEIATTGTRRILEFAVERNARKLLFVSSGAVYGRDLQGVGLLSEDHPCHIDVFGKNAAYDEGKRVSELLCGVFSSQFGLQTKVARCFSFVGPYLPLDKHFAIGNFIYSAIQNSPIEIKGDGTPRRSYLYAADLMIWLWTILFRGASCRPYNVGSENALSIKEIAQVVAAECNPPLSVNVLGAQKPGVAPSSYVPSTQRAREELGLQERVTLKDAIIKTQNWARSNLSAK